VTSDSGPAEALARARYEAEQFEPDHPWFVGWDDVRPTLRQGLVEEAEDDIDHLVAAGFRVVPEPDDDTREDAAALVWACSTALLFGPSSRKRMADLLAAAYLSGDGGER
jgi:hypothetical protein